MDPVGAPTVPLIVVHRAGQGFQRPQRRSQDCKDIFHHGLCVCVGRIHDLDTACLTGGQVDVVESGTGAPDDAIWSMIITA